ncbi:NAD(P)-binding domain-containing protein [Mariniflexile litorale]|uniref:NAD(P)-binding domain-containing protein n=1 Tax=Mariniflexile litorale TaxID=3045158 RepID=A0AAU7EDU8_9FLAO|nr:NAD(P)-binding domain-containing protein [Mariniflexile sp. KMM 9835]MDQ8213035.1 NAD(P)-binding domain-containing protein [Mariniflexile sp. KMM 9835]
MQTAIIGTGKIGEAIAKKLIKAGHSVLLTNNKGAESLKDKAASLGNLAIPADISEVNQAEVLFLTVRWSHLQQVAADVPNLEGKILVDVTNPILDDMSFDDLKGKAASEIVQELFPKARVVKTLNHYFLKWIDEDPKVDNGKRIAFVSGDDTEAKNTVTNLLNEFGFKSIDLGNLAAGSKLQQAGGSLAALNIVSYPA